MKSLFKIRQTVYIDQYPSKFFALNYPIINPSSSGNGTSTVWERQHSRAPAKMAITWPIVKKVVSIFLLAKDVSEVVVSVNFTSHNVA